MRSNSPYRFSLSLLLFCSWMISTPTRAMDYDDIAPIFQKHCVMCHNGPAAPKGLRLDSLENLLKGSQSGPVIVAGNADSSELMRRIQGNSQPRMPLTGPPYLPEQDVVKISQWINDGARAGATPPAVSSAAPRRLPNPTDDLSYSDIAPILGQRCVKCHHRDAPNGPPEGLSLQTYEDLIGGGERAVVIPGIPEISAIDQRVRGIAQPRMPFDGPPWLSSEEIELISAWIKQGARDAAGNAADLPIGQPLRLQGRLTGRWSINGIPLVVDSRTRIKKRTSPGDYVEVRGRIDHDGRIHATRIRRR